MGARVAALANSVRPRTPKRRQSLTPSGAAIAPAVMALEELIRELDALADAEEPGA
jgi:hypothetical protein